jgi:hypothetical protein
LKLRPSDPHRSSTEPASRSGRAFGIAALAALTALLCSGATSPTGCQSSGTIGPSKGEVIGAAVGIVAVITVAIVVVVEVNHGHHVVTGCVVTGPDGLQLRTSDAKTYTLEGDAASIKVGDRVKFHGSKVKKTKDTAGNQVFKVEKIQKDYGPCPAQP